MDQDQEILLLISLMPLEIPSLPVLPLSNTQGHRETDIPHQLVDNHLFGHQTRHNLPLDPRRLRVQQPFNRIENIDPTSQDLLTLPRVLGYQSLHLGPQERAQTPVFLTTKHLIDPQQLLQPLPKSQERLGERRQITTLTIRAILVPMTPQDGNLCHRPRPKTASPVSTPTKSMTSLP
jgi:hypothetical protein